MLPDNTLKALSLVDELEDSKRQIAVLQASVNSLLPYKLFYNHIKAHLPNEHCQVACKICNKTFDQVIQEVITP